jgi:fluoride ion exporter CrcB/FEX
MTRFLAGLCSFLVFFSAFAEDVKDVPPPETTNVLGIAIFFILFIGMCAGFFGYMWWRHKHGKED